MDFNFNLKEAEIYRAVQWGKYPTFRFALFFKKLFFVLFILSFLLFLYGFILEKFSLGLSKFFFGTTVLLFTITEFFWLQELFFNLRIKKPRLKVKIENALLTPEEYNLAEFLDFDIAKAVEKAQKWAVPKNFSEIDSTLLLYFLLEDNPKLRFIFYRAILDLKKIKKFLKDYLKKISAIAKGVKVKTMPVYSDGFKKVILDSLKIASDKEKERIEVGDVISSLVKHDPVFQKILVETNVKPEDIENLIWWLENLERKTEERKKWWEYKNLAKWGTMAKEWTAGYTITLDQFGADWSEIVKKKGFPDIIGHKDTILAIERALSRTEVNDVLLIGDSGAGRKSVIEAVAARSALGQSLPEVNYKRFVELNLPRLLAQTQDMEEAEKILNKIFQEVLAAGNIILIIDEFHNFVATKGGLGIADISGLLYSFLRSPQFQVIAITTFPGLHRNIEQNPSLLSFFEKVEISEISERDTLMLLEVATIDLEMKRKVLVSYPALRDIVSYSARYLPSLPFPEKAINLLDEVTVFVGTTGEKVVLPKHVAKIITEKTQIPVGEIETKEREILLNLEELIHKRIINQEEAVDEVSAALRRARAEITVRSGPMGAFLFLGPTGVGKTETAKALAAIYFGSEARMITMDMSEFQDVKDIPKLIGSPGEEGLLTTQVRENPFSLVLLDEIEKSHPNILNLFLQVLDEGRVTDGLGRKVDFKSAIIIATSNAGYKLILEALREKADFSKIKEKLLDYLFEEGIFRPEFINRFDAVVVFKPLSKENLLAIAELLMQKLKKNLRQKGIDLVITLPLKEKIVELGYNPTFGARNMRRVIQDKVENVLAKAILSHQLKRGDRVEIEPEKFQLLINQ